MRLYNINSIYFTGGANINRYEHSLGVCYLALQCVESIPEKLDEDEKKLIVLAGLMHDLYNAAFGHSVEYVEKNFSPEDLFTYEASGEKSPSFKNIYTDLEPIFFGMCREISQRLNNVLKITNNDIKKIGRYINGKGKYGLLISGSMDLDNLDNIYRMSYHMGLTQDTQTPLKIAKSLWVKDGRLYIDEKALPLVDDWVKLRERLYRYLLLNPDEFSAKFMLTEATEYTKKDNKKVYTWYDTDFQILEKLYDSSQDVGNIIKRLMSGNLYGCLGLFKSKKINKIDYISDLSTRTKIEKNLNSLIKPEVQNIVSDFTDREQNAIKGIQGIYYDSEKFVLRLSHRAKKSIIDNLTKSDLKKHKEQIDRMYFLIQEKVNRFNLKSPDLGIHIITDINKTKRQVTLYSKDGSLKKIGKAAKQFYIGIFIKNVQYTNFNINNNREIKKEYVTNIKSEVKNYLIDLLEDPKLEELSMYSEVENE